MAENILDPESATVDVPEQPGNQPRKVEGTVADTPGNDAQTGTQDNGGLNLSELRVAVSYFYGYCSSSQQ